MKFLKLTMKHWAGIVFAAFTVTVSLVFFMGQSLSYFLMVVSAVLFLLPFVLSFLEKQRWQREKEEKFLEFTRDLVENVRSGTPISKSIINLRRRNYGTLSPHIAKLANQLSMGITLESSFETFSGESRSPMIAKAVTLIIEAERAGGDISNVLESVSRSVNQIETLKKERKAAVSNLVTQGYIIFMIFIVIMLVLEFKILPMVYDISAVEGLSVGSGAGMDQGSFSTPLLAMILVQSFFAGLVIGKISEGTIKRGIKHSFILLALTLLITTGFRAIFG